MSVSAPVAPPTWHALLPDELLAKTAGLSEGYQAVLLADPAPHESPRETYRDGATLARLGLTDEERTLFLKAKWSGYYRDITDREIERVVENTRLDVLGTRTGPTYRPFNPELREKVVAGSAGTLESLKKASRVPDPGVLAAGTVIDALFPGNPLLCFASDKARSTTQKRGTYRGTEADYQFLVPNTMSSEYGETQDGRLTARSNKNVGPQVYQVVEFDTGALDEQARLHLHLQAHGVPLVMVVFSGGKSLHGWYRVSDLGGEKLSTFLNYASALGADRATYVPCQLVRMPNGLRCDDTHNDVKQEVLFLDVGAAR